MKKAHIYISLIILLLVGTYAVVGIFKDSHRTSEVPQDENESPFESIIAGYNSYHEWDEGIEGEYLWKKLDLKNYSCNLSSNEGFLILNEKARIILQMYKNLSVNATSNKDLIGVLLLADLNDRMRTLTADYLSPFAERICLMENRLENFEAYRKKALEVYGESSFSFDDISNLSLAFRNFTYKTYGYPFSNSWIVDVRVLLKHFIYRAIYNESLVEPFLSDYTPKKSASLLTNLSAELEKDPYAESLFKPSLLYLANWWSWEYRHSSNPEEVNEKYLKIFWAWYKLANPERFIGR